MTDSARKTAQLLATIPVVELPVGVFVQSNADGTVDIDFGEGPVSCMSAGSFSAIAGDSVRCLRTSAGTVMLGPSMPRAATGVIAATGSPLVTVTTSIGAKQMPYLSSYSPVVGDLVAIDWATGGIVLGKVTAAPSGTYTPPTLPTPSEFSVDFKANDSGSYQSGSWWTKEVWCSSTNIGAWFYGSKIKDTIPDSATVKSVKLYVPEFYNEFPTSLATIGTHTLGSKSGAPVVSNAVTISKGTGWKTLPNSFGTALKTGSALGVGTNHGGYHKFTSKANDASSGMLRIVWTT